MPVFFTFCHWKYFWNRCWMSKFTWQSSFFSLAVRLSCCRLNHIPYVCFKHLRVLPCVNLVIRWFHANWDNLEGHCEEMTSDLDRVSAIEYLTSTIGKEMAFQKSSKIKVLIYRLKSECGTIGLKGHFQIEQRCKAETWNFFIWHHKVLLGILINISDLTHTTLHWRYLNWRGDPVVCYVSRVMLSSCAKCERITVYFGI